MRFDLFFNIPANYSNFAFFFLFFFSVSESEDVINTISDLMIRFNFVNDFLFFYFSFFCIQFYTFTAYSWKCSEAIWYFNFIHLLNVLDSIQFNSIQKLRAVKHTNIGGIFIYVYAEQISFQDEWTFRLYKTICRMMNVSLLHHHHHYQPFNMFRMKINWENWK